MIGLLDPYLFYRVQQKPPEEQVFIKEVEAFLKLRKELSLRFLMPAAYYAAFRTLAKGVQLNTPKAQQLRNEILKLAEKLPDQIVSPARVYGFRRMFGGLPTPASKSWEDLAANAVLQLRSQGPVLFLASLVEGRNVKQHEPAYPLNEITLWRLTVQAQGATWVVPCVRVARQWHQRWTTRYDPGLPGCSDNSAHYRYPFCVPQDWYLKRRKPVQPQHGRPAFVDASGKGWVRPKTPGEPHHWDVYFDDTTLRQRLNLLDPKVSFSTVNVVRWKPLPSEGAPGDIHHKGKQRQLKDVGWAC